MQSTIITILLTIFASTGFWTFMSEIFKAKRSKNSVEREALLGLLHDRIFEYGHAYIERGEISVEEYDNFMSLYLPYEKLGGNGTGKKLKIEVDKLHFMQRN